MSFNQLKKRLNVSSEFLNKIDRLYSDIKKYNKVHNITRISTKDDFTDKHVYDSIYPFLNILEKKKEDSFSVLDLGSGAGFPSIPLSFYFNSAKIYSIDSKKKKTNFVKKIKLAENLEKLHPINARIEMLDDSISEKFDIVIARALGNEDKILGKIKLFLKDKGCFCCYLGENSPFLIKMNSESGGKLLDSYGLKILLNKEYRLINGDKRFFLVINKKSV